MFNLLRDVKYLTEKKVTNPFFATYFFVLLYRNWELIFTLFNFDDDCTLDDKLHLINQYFNKLEFIDQIWTNLWVTAVVIVISYLLYFGFRALANLFERKVFPIADKIDNDLVVTKERYLKVKEDLDNLNKEFKYVRDENIKLDKNYADIKKELADYDEQFIIKHTEISKLKDVKAILDENTIILDKKLDFLEFNKKIFVQSLTRLVNITTRRMHALDKYLPFLNKYDKDYKKTYKDLSVEDYHWFINEDLLTETDGFGRAQTLLGSVLYKYHTQKVTEESKKLDIPQCIEHSLAESFKEYPFKKQFILS